MVDGFRWSGDWCSHYFLTHGHSDHYTGLRDTWSHGTIYCSDITARVVQVAAALRASRSPLARVASSAGRGRRRESDKSGRGARLTDARVLRRSSNLDRNHVPWLRARVRPKALEKLAFDPRAESLFTCRGPIRVEDCITPVLV